MLSEADLNIIFYTLFLFLGLPISYKYASYMVKKTGIVLAHFFVSLMLNLCIGVVGIIGWIFFSVRVSEFLLLGGIFLGAGITLLSLIVLLLLLLITRKKMLAVYNDTESEVL
jgi:hypothetical protein